MGRGTQLSGRVSSHGAVSCWIHSPDGPIELFFIPAIAPQLVQQMMLYVLSCL